MRTVRLFPAAVGACIVDHGVRKAGCLRLVGGGDFGDVGLDVILDQAMLGQLEAEISRLRVDLRVDA